MKKMLSVLFAVIAASAAFADDLPATIHKGFGTGQDFADMKEVNKRAYAIGAVNGMLMAPLLGASKNEMKWLESYVESLTDKQAAAILTRYLKDNPSRLHDELNVVTFNAIKQAHDKNRTP